MEFVFI